MNGEPIETLTALCEKMRCALGELGVIVVDHGSRRAESNQALLRVVSLFRQQTPYQLVEPAHMELAEPSIATAFDRLVSAEAKLIVVHPYFLLPGRHWAQDIPALVADAAAAHTDVEYLVTAPLGIHPLMSKIMHDRIEHCMRHVAGTAESCELCDEPKGRCRA